MANKIIALYVNLNSLYDACAYWTKNRVYSGYNKKKGVYDPNSNQDMNYTYGMGEDDREFFFKEYSRKACAEAAMCMRLLRKNLKIDGVTADDSNCYRWSWDTRSCLFVGYVRDDFPTAEVLPLVEEYIRLIILRYWYRMKMLMAEVQYMDAEIADCKSRLLSIGQRYNSTSTGSSKICYNDGFSLRSSDFAQIIYNLQTDNADDINYAGIDYLINDAEITNHYYNEGSTAEIDTGEYSFPTITLTVPEGIPEGIYKVDDDGNLVIQL